MAVMQMNIGSAISGRVIALLLVLASIASCWKDREPPREPLRSTARNSPANSEVSGASRGVSSTSMNLSVVVSAELKAKLTELRPHLVLLSDPLGAENKAQGIEAVLDDEGQAITGLLRYRASQEGPVAAILGGIHMSELSGVSALLKFHERWLRGARPKSGSVIVVTADPKRALEFIDRVLHAETVPKEEWVSFNLTRDKFNFNRIPFDILNTEGSTPDERHAYRIAKYVLAPAEGKVLDIHNTSVEAPPMVTLFMKQDETPEMSIARINRIGVADGLPIHDFIVWKPGPYNGMESMRSLGDSGSDTAPILVETGASFDASSFARADRFAQLWLMNSMGLEPNREFASARSAQAARTYYVETGAMYHPAVRPEDYDYLSRESFAEAKTDTFILIRDSQSLDDIVGWSSKGEKTLHKLDRSALRKNRLDNFMAIKKGDIVAIGLNTGLEIRAPQDGFVLMAGANPYIKPTLNESFINFAEGYGGTF